MMMQLRRTRRGIAYAAISLALAMPALAAVVSSEAFAETPPASGPAEPAADAARRAQATGEAVEDVSQRTETTRVFANPDGSWRQETFADPVRVEDEDGDWHDLDTTLVSSGDGFAPKYALTDVEISGGGESEFATLTEDGHTVAFSWDEDLPEPVIKGNTATYEDVAPGQDLVVTALPGGFEHSLVLHERPEGDVDFTTEVSVDGARITESADGGAVIKAADGDVVATVEQPVVYDAGEVTQPVSADAELTGSPASGQELTVTAEEDYLSDPETEYPVTIDPVVQIFTSGDTWIQNGSTTNQGSNPELRVGTFNSGSSIARAYIDFPDQDWSGKQIQSADLVMYNTYSATCTSLQINASRITQPWSFSNIAWPGPTAGANTAGFSTAYGAPSGSCGGGGYTHFNVKGILDAWKSGQPNYGIRLMASNEQSNNSFRKYYSANYTAAPTSVPHINVTYDQGPRDVEVSVSPCTDCDLRQLFTNTLTPTLVATSTDEAASIAYTWRIKNPAGTVVYTSSPATSGAPGEDVSRQLPSGYLLDDVNYQIQVSASDGGATTSSSWMPLLVDDDAPSDAVQPVGTAYPGVNSDELNDVEGIAEAEGTTVAAAATEYVKQRDFINIVTELADANPNTYAYAEAGEGQDAPVIAWSEPDPNITVSAAIAMVGLGVQTVTDAPASEPVLEAAVDATIDAIQAQAGSGAAVSAGIDPVTGHITAEVYVPPASAPSPPPTPSSLRVAAAASIVQTVPEFDLPPNVTVTLVDQPTFAPTSYNVNVPGGIQMYSTGPSPSTCTAGFPARELSTNFVGVLTAQHCVNNLFHYDAWDRQTFSAPLEMGLSYGDVQYQRLNTAIGYTLKPRFFWKRGYVRALTGYVKDIKKVKVCMYGRATDKRMCGKVSRLTIAVDYSEHMGVPRYTARRLVQIDNDLVKGGDSGGPVYIGNKAFGIISGEGCANAQGNYTCTFVSPITRFVGAGRTSDIRLFTN